MSTKNWQQYSAVSCKPHQNWLQIDQYRVFLKSATGDIDPKVQIYIDLTGGSYLKRVIPPQLQELLGNPSLIMMEWELLDGYTCDQLPNMVVTLLEAGYVVGWGCVGGHGRTGWLAAKVLQELTNCSGNEAVDYVRKNYCASAIETQNQLNDLNSDRPIKPFTVVVDNTYSFGKKWDRELQCWVEITSVEQEDSCDIEMTYTELEKSIERLLWESDEEYEARTDILLEKYYKQFDDGTKSVFWD
jgi:hypothetical protein